MIPKNLRPLLTSLGKFGEDLNMPVYAVGGFVRDCMLKRPGGEIDFVVVGDGPAFAEHAKDRLGGHSYVVYQRFGTASFLHDNLKLEFVSARKESYRDSSRNPDVSKTTLEEDLKRRDFTMNAMAMDLGPKSPGKVTDPFHGAEDIRKKRIRTPLEPEATFSEDPLRILRAARFASQLHFEIDQDTKRAMSATGERLKIVSQERITDELLKILSHDQPSVGFFILLETGVLDIILPELSHLVGVEQRDDHHHKDVFEHTMKVLDNISGMTDDLLLRFTALMHDIGKPRVKKYVEGTGWTFHGHEMVGVRMLKKIVPRLKLPNTYLKYSQKLTGLHMRPIQLIGEEVTDSAIRRLIVHAGPDIQDLMTLCRADITSGNPARVQKHLSNFDYVVERMNEVEEKDRLRMFQSPVRGDEIMTVCGLEPGPEVGRLKGLIEEAILEGHIPNEHDAALDYLMKINNR
ncbi:HD domain-containing protein [bacterium]|nr:HD domain-containing protein [bacterium]